LRLACQPARRPEAIVRPAIAADHANRDSTHDVVGPTSLFS
jgi:hypothetical protein